MQDTISILRGLKNSYELHHGIRVKDEALVAAATLSNRYLSDRKQPDKSIDLVDEACSRLRLEQESKPEVIWKVERDLLTKQIEQSALANEEDDTKSKTRKEQVDSEVKVLQTELNHLQEMWVREKDELVKGKKLQEKLDAACRELLAAWKTGDLAKAAELQHSVIPLLEDEMEVRSIKCSATMSPPKLLPPLSLGILASPSHELREANRVSCFNLKIVFADVSLGRRPL